MTSKFGYQYLITTGNAFQSIFLLAVRLFWGWQFAITGFGKFQNMESTIDFFSSLSLPFPEFTAHLTAFCELVGGVCLVLGFCSRLWALVLCMTMVVALWSAHLDSVKILFSEPLTFVMQLPFSFLFACLLLFIFGPGKLSLDHWIYRHFFRSQHH